MTQKCELSVLSLPLSVVGCQLSVGSGPLEVATESGPRTCSLRPGGRIPSSGRNGEHNKKAGMCFGLNGLEICTQNAPSGAPKAGMSFGINGLQICTAKGPRTSSKPEYYLFCANCRYALPQERQRGGAALYQRLSGGRRKGRQPGAQKRSRQTHDVTQNERHADMARISAGCEKPRYRAE